jgi:hypothetical protein
MSAGNPGRCTASVRAFRKPSDVVVIGINFGSESDWVKNVLATGGCRLTRGGGVLDLGEPRLVPVSDGVEGVPWWFGPSLRCVVQGMHGADSCFELTALDHLSRVTLVDAAPPSSTFGRVHSPNVGLRPPGGGNLASCGLAMDVAAFNDD